MKSGALGLRIQLGFSYFLAKLLDPKALVSSKLEAINPT